MNRVLLLVVLMCFLVAMPVLAGPRIIKAAVGTVASAGYEIPDPYVFDNLNSSGYKPADWTFTNPHANAGYAFATNMSALSTAQLLDYDLIMLTNHTLTSFTEADKTSLQTWISAGGTLWIDDCGNMNVQNFFVPFNYDSYDYDHLPAPTDGGKFTPYPSFSFFNSVYTLTAQEIAFLGSPGFSSNVIGYNPADWSVLLYNRGYDGVNRPDMLLKGFGDGRIIVTADDYSCTYNELYKAEDYKLAYNIMAWAQSEDKVTNPEVPEASCLMLALPGLAALTGLRKLRRS